jgi:hypothetical protein
MDNQGGNIESDGLSLLVYGTKSIRDNLYVDGTVGVGQFDYDTRRNLNYTARGTLVNQQAVGSTEADLTFASVGVGFDSAYGQGKGILLSFSGRLNYVNADVDGFTESISTKHWPSSRYDRICHKPVM